MVGIVLAVSVLVILLVMTVLAMTVLEMMVLVAASGMQVTMVLQTVMRHGLHMVLTVQH